MGASTRLSQRMIGVAGTVPVPTSAIRVVVGVATAVAALAAFLPGIGTATLVALLGATCSALAKVALDAVIQRDLPERSRASAFGRSETVLQLAWVFGGALGVLLPHDTPRWGFGVVTGVIVLVGAQAALATRGRSLVPSLRRPAAAGSPLPSRSA